MLNSFIFVVMPYAALALLIFVTPYRFCSNRLTWSAYSTQFLEGNVLFWGINPWHYGIIPVLAGHFLGVVAPGPMKVFLGNQTYLIVFESIGLALGLFALFGCLLLLLRRVNTPILKQVTFAADWVLLYLLAAQALSGVYIATYMRWGSPWYLHTAVPYLWSARDFSPARSNTWAEFSPGASSCTRACRLPESGLLLAVHQTGCTRLLCFRVRFPEGTPPNPGIPGGIRKKLTHFLGGKRGFCERGTVLNAWKVSPSAQKSPLKYFSLL